MAKNDEKVSSRQGCMGCLVVILLVVGGIGWFGWSQYQQLKYAIDLVEGKVDIPWEVTAVVYFGSGGDPKNDTDGVMDRLDTLAEVMGGTTESAFECALGVCNFLEFGGIRIQHGVVLTEMEAFAGTLRDTVTCEQFMRAFIQRHYPEAERRIMNSTMSN